MSDEDIKNNIKNTFDEVATRYENIDFFKISAKNIADLLPCEGVSNVLDVACGTGNVVLEYASTFADANFDAVDISTQMLKCAKEKAKEQNITNITFHCCDIETLDMQKQYDIVTCSYALFFLPNPIETLKILYAHVKTGGTLIFTSFTQNAFSPSSKILGDLFESFEVKTPQKSWKTLQTTQEITYLCNQADIKDFDIHEKAIRYPLSLPEWWSLNNDTAHRGILLQLSLDDYESVKEMYFEAMQWHEDESRMVELNADTFYTIIRKETNK
ncbi:class I SAM-dependent methyltransferase [Candidatus Sulfurimonas marisnigri]|uniref:Class I SAM-dependent methyltransferase n=1 Tax=Candidatus Sulfurimonas marisnigri TaxID=2740405 RepID=A0A7S7RR93_9BACT|nr:class I SAM-dependent methyltransferase [Candidatus Sulfurimonas marisnigri]QOY55469.1 class I SAM-dependent methyltransferase [Candidatus Sulfurimonas marisnigri]